MDTAPRVKRLRELIAELELLPASPDRDRLLSEFRSRAVDIDTGVTPRALLPLREIQVAPPPRHNRRPKMPPAPPPPPAVTRARPLDEHFGHHERLSLDDALTVSAPPAQARDDRAVAPWTLGLRG